MTEPTPILLEGEAFRKFREEVETLTAPNEELQKFLYSLTTKFKGGKLSDADLTAIIRNTLQGTPGLVNKMEKDSDYFKNVKDMVAAIAQAFKDSMAPVTPQAAAAPAVQPQA